MRTVKSSLLGALSRVEVSWCQRGCHGTFGLEHHSKSSYNYANRMNKSKEYYVRRFKVPFRSGMC